MAPPNNFAKRKTPSLVEDDLWTLIVDTKLGLLYLVEPSSTLKRSKINTSKEGGEFTPTFIIESSDIPNHTSAD